MYTTVDRFACGLIDLVCQDPGEPSSDAASGDPPVSNNRPGRIATTASPQFFFPLHTPYLSGVLGTTAILQGRFWSIMQAFSDICDCHRVHEVEQHLFCEALWLEFGIARVIVFSRSDSLSSVTVLFGRADVLTLVCSLHAASRLVRTRDCFRQARSLVVVDAASRLRHLRQLCRPIIITFILVACFRGNFFILFNLIPDV